MRSGRCAAAAAADAIDATDATAHPTAHGAAESIDAALEAGSALAFLGQKNVHFGVDQIVAITDDGRGYIWHQLNECGEKSYDGTVVGEACPDRPGVSQ